MTPNRLIVGQLIAGRFINDQMECENFAISLLESDIFKNDRLVFDKYGIHRIDILFTISNISDIILYLLDSTNIHNRYYILKGENTIESNILYFCIYKNTGHSLELFKQIIKTFPEVVDDFLLNDINRQILINGKSQSYNCVEFMISNLAIDFLNVCLQDYLLSKKLEKNQILIQLNNQKLINRYKEINVDSCEKIVSFIKSNYNDQELMKSRDNTGRTLLMIAISNNNDILFDHILEICNDEYLNFCCENGDTALHYAVLCGNITYLNKLIDRNNIQLNVQNSSWKTPIFLACENKNVKILHTLCKNIDQNNKHYINIADVYGFTPLHMACNLNHETHVEYLLELGANIDICNEYNIDPKTIIKRSKVLSNNEKIQHLIMDMCTKVKKAKG